MTDLVTIFNSFLVASQVVLSFSAAFVLLFSRRHHKQHSYLAGFVSSLWAGGMMAYAVGSIVYWPKALDSASIIEVGMCGLSAGLAFYSGGSIFKVARLCRRMCGSGRI